MVKPHENIGKPQQSTKIHGIHCHGGTEVMLGTNDAWHRNGEPKKVAEASPKHRSGRVRKGPEGSGRVRKGLGKADFSFIFKSWSFITFYHGFYRAKKE